MFHKNKKTVLHNVWLFVEKQGQIWCFVNTSNYKKTWWIYRILFQFLNIIWIKSILSWLKDSSLLRFLAHFNYTLLLICKTLQVRLLILFFIACKMLQVAIPKVAPPCGSILCPAIFLKVSSSWKFGFSSKRISFQICNHVFTRE